MEKCIIELTEAELQTVKKALHFRAEWEHDRTECLGIAETLGNIVFQTELA